MLELDGLTISTKKRILVRDLSLRLPERGITALIGPSGCGKSSVLKGLAGVLPAALEMRGLIKLNGERIGLPHRAIGYQPQNDALFPWLTLAENAALGLRVAGVSRRAAHERLLPFFAIFGLGGLQDLFPAEVSGGMRQRVAFLRTILRDTAVVLLDEPFSALDAVTRLKMQSWLLERFRQMPRSVLIVTHDLHEATQMADRILVMAAEPGRLIADFPIPIAPASRDEHALAPLRATLKSLLLEEIPS